MVNVNIRLVKKRKSLGGAIRKIINIYSVYIYNQSHTTILTALFVF